MTLRCLSMHAGYGCRHSGACCSGVFAIPAEPHVLAVVGAMNIAAATPRFVAHPDGGDGAFVAVRPDGACVFFEADYAGSCSIHRRAGAAALPSACRHFPRVFLDDARGSFVSLSHFCPTAAALLFDERPLRVVDAGPPLALDGDVEAFDAVNALPPLLRPDVLMDLEAYDLWERACVATFARDDLTHEQALSSIASAAELIRQWAPGAPPLAVRVAEAFEAAAMRGVGPVSIDDDHLRLDLIDAAGLPRAAGVTRAREAEPTWARFVAPVWDAFDGPIKRYLASKLFGHRIAYECRGVRSMVDWLRTCLALLRSEATRLCEGANAALDRSGFVEAVRRTDLVLVHRIDTAALARAMQPCETLP